MAYFTQNEAVRGDKEFQYEWNHGVWHFSSAENLAKFKQNPERYAPQYGGWCAYAAAVNNDLVTVSPKAFAVVNDKLYLNYNDSINEKWNAQKESYIEQADKKWPELLAD